MYKYIFVLFSTLVFSQKSTLKIVSSIDNKALEKVLIYNDKNLLGETNDKGEIVIELNSNKIKIVKEDFEDIELEKDDLIKMDWMVKLNPIKLIEIDTVVVSKTNEEPLSVLKKINRSRFKQNHKQFKYYQSKILFKGSNVPLFSFNNIIYLSDELKVNDKNKIIYLGKRKNSSENDSTFEYFNFLNKECQIPIPSSVYCSLTDYSISPIFDGRLYNYVLEKTEEFYVLKFSPKNKNSVLLYEGYFIVDKFDFGIIELNMSLFASKKNVFKTNAYNLQTKFTYLISEDTFKFKFFKNENDYFLESSSRKMVCTQTEGNHVGKQFIFTLNNEETVNHEGLIFKDFDFINYKFK